MPSEHIVKSYDEELGRLNKGIIAMGGLAETQLSAAIQAVVKRDADLAAEVVRNDTEVDQLDRDIEAQAVRLLALRQPMARDLREIVSALKISSDLERICDYAANIAKRSIALSQSPIVRPIYGVPRMAKLAQRAVTDVLDAYIHRDAEKARAVWLADEELDELYTSLFRELLTYMMEDPRSITGGTHVLFMAKNVERIGDHATNIAETVYYLINGVQLMETRPKKDRTSTSVVLPGPTGIVESDGGNTEA
ncbi:MAG TPA: phosphate signaling complex protein PhoU [Stellaceae bacterium]|nr:phosphate signaling complex protein PhoU [Stellaceae bacterium]